jgi:hypothetical protein
LQVKARGKIQWDQAEPSQRRSQCNGTCKKSWFIDGQTKAGAPISYSFVEFDERGDFIDFEQHRDCGRRIKKHAGDGGVLLVMYCHGWKNSSQSRDVIRFNAFLSKLADSDEIRARGLKVQGVYLGWRGNEFKPYVADSEEYGDNARIKEVYGQPIVDDSCNRNWFWTAAIPENLSYWHRKRAAEHRVSALPIARAIFTYAATAKGYGEYLTNRVVVMGHSFGALLLERGLGQAMTGALINQWWDKLKVEADISRPEAVRQQTRQNLDATNSVLGLPFDLTLFVNSAAPAIYAKEMRDFLMAHRKALGIGHNPAQDVPVIVSVTSTADKATGVLYPIGNFLAPFSPSLKRKYTTGIFGLQQKDGSYPPHRPVRQSKFYTNTPGHHDYLINHWIVRDKTGDFTVRADKNAFMENLSMDHTDYDKFLTSSPQAVWKLTASSPNPTEVDGMPIAMSDSGYWIVSCGKDLIKSHGDVWSNTAMELYAGIFRACEARRQ